MVSDDEHVCGSLSMAVAAPASQSVRDCGRVAEIAELAPQWKRLKLLGGSQDTTVGMPSHFPTFSKTIGDRTPHAGNSIP